MSHKQPEIGSRWIFKVDPTFRVWIVTGNKPGGTVEYRQEGRARFGKSYLRDRYENATPAVTFSAQAWDAFDEWRAELEEEVGFQALGEVPPEKLARIFNDSATLADASSVVRAYVGALS